MSEISKSHGMAHGALSETPTDVGESDPTAKRTGVKAIARNVYLNDRWLQCALLAFMAVYYGFVLNVTATHYLMNKTFNSMLDHLVHGQVDVDPNVIGYEGFLHNGHVYSYFGITCALLRLPLLLFHRLDLDVTVWSCLVAVCLAGMMKIRAVLFLRRHCGATPASEGVFALMLTYIVLGGAEVGYLKSSIFQEVIFWAVAFAAVFVYFAVKGIVNGQFTVATLSWMALAAGLALLTRVSTGIGLCAAFALLLFVLMIEELYARRTIFTRRFLAPVAVLTALIILVGTVNYLRWGNPATFADYKSYIIANNQRDHRDALLMQAYGTFNLVRTPYTLGYYFFPVFAMQGPHGHLLFQETQTRLFSDIELPPSSFLLTDLLPFCFIALLAIALWKHRNLGSPPAGKWAAAVALGLFVPCALMLTLIWMTYRYRMEFYPEIDFLAFLGLYATVSNPALLAWVRRRHRWMLAATMVSIASAFAAMMLYWFSDWGPYQRLLGGGLVHYYMQNGYLYLKNSGFAFIY